MYDASRAQVDLGPIKFSYSFQGFLRARDTAQAAAGFPFLLEEEWMTEAVEPKETKAQRAERLKRAKNPWEAFDEVRAFAREGRSSVVPEWARTYFKWWGIYTQGDGVGAAGGKGGEGLATDYFMMRIGIPNGIIYAEPVAYDRRALPGSMPAILPISPFGRTSSFTGSRIESLPEVVDALDAIGLSPKGACGDVVRNVTGCPLAGVAHDEIIDASPIAL